MAEKLMNLGDNPSLSDVVFRCGICRKFLSVPPIHSCDSVSYICGVCFNANRFYPNEPSRSEDNPRREFLYEKLAALLKFPCSFKGCNASLEFGDEVRAHEKVCKFMSFSCPISRANRGFLKHVEQLCEWSNREYSEVVSHVENNHYEYKLSHPHILALNDLVTSTNRQQMFIMRLSNTLVAVLTSDFTPSGDVEFRCRLNRSSAEADHFRCTVEIKPEPSVLLPLRTIKCISLDKDETEEERQQSYMKIPYYLEKSTTLRFFVQYNEEDCYIPSPTNNESINADPSGPSFTVSDIICPLGDSVSTDSVSELSRSFELLKLESKNSLSTNEEDPMSSYEELHGYLETCSSSVTDTDPPLTSDILGYSSADRMNNVKGGTPTDHEIEISRPGNPLLSDSSSSMLRDEQSPKCIRSEDDMELEPLSENLWEVIDIITEPVADSDKMLSKQTNMTENRFESNDVDNIVPPASLPIISNEEVAHTFSTIESEKLPLILSEQQEFERTEDKQTKVPTEFCAAEEQASFVSTSNEVKYFPSVETPPSFITAEALEKVLSSIESILVLSQNKELKSINTEEMNQAHLLHTNGGNPTSACPHPSPSKTDEKNEITLEELSNAISSCLENTSKSNGTGKVTDTMKTTATTTSNGSLRKSTTQKVCNGKSSSDNQKGTLSTSESAQKLKSFCNGKSATKSNEKKHEVPSNSGTITSPEERTSKKKCDSTASYNRKKLIVGRKEKVFPDKVSKLPCSFDAKLTTVREKSSKKVHEKSVQVSTSSHQKKRKTPPETSQVVENKNRPVQENSQSNPANKEQPDKKKDPNEELDSEDAN